MLFNQAYFLIKNKKVVRQEIMLKPPLYGREAFLYFPVSIIKNKLFDF
jgi:hypothetical protein